MPAHKKPSKIHKLKGSFDKNPNRENKNEPEGKGKFPEKPPEHLTGSQAICWHEIKDLVPAGVLTGSDTIIIEICSYLLDQVREEKGAVHVSVIARLTSEMNKLGLDPSGRAKLEIEKPKGNKFAD